MEIKGCHASVAAFLLMMQTFDAPPLALLEQ
jgi:hypothetical protein